MTAKCGRDLWDIMHGLTVKSMTSTNYHCLSIFLPLLIRLPGKWLLPPDKAPERKKRGSIWENTMQPDISMQGPPCENISIPLQEVLIMLGTARCKAYLFLFALSKKNVSGAMVQGQGPTSIAYCNVLKTTHYLDANELLPLFLWK